MCVLTVRPTHEKYGSLSLRLPMKKTRSSKRFFTVAYLRRSRKLARYLEDKPWMRRLYRDLLELRPGISVVDVGCGTGEFTRQIAHLVAGRCRIIGVDLRAASLRNAASETKRAGLSDRISYRKGDVFRIPVEDGFAHLTCCRALLMHLTDPLSAVIEMSRVTRSGGLVTAVEPGRMRSFYDPENEKFTELDEEMGRAYLKGLRKVEGKEFGIGEQLPSIFQRAGLQDIRAEILADAWTPSDTRLKEEDVKATLRLGYQLFKEGKRDERRILLAAGIPPRKLTSYLRLSEQWYRKLLANDEELAEDAV